MPAPGIMPITTQSSAPVFANLALWLKADAITGLADGGTVTTWNDSSGNGFHCGANGAAAHYRTTSVTINGKPVVYFDNNPGGLSRFENIFFPTFQVGWTGASAFIVARVNEDPPVDPNKYSKCGVWSLSGSNSSVLVGTEATYPDDSNIYDATFTTAFKTITNPTPSLTSPFLYGVISTNGSWEARLNSSSLLSTGTNTFDVLSGTGEGGSIKIGKGELVGVRGVYLCGVIAEVMVFSTNLNPTDRAAVETYLTAKYAI